jgi:hypothetical protein
MTLGSFIYFIHEFFLKYENALDLSFFEKYASNNYCFLKSDFNFEKSTSNNSIFENLISTLKNLLAIIIVFENQMSTLKNLLAIILSLKIRFQL